MISASERLVQIGMRAVIRDIQEWVDTNSWREDGTYDQNGAIVDADYLKAYLLACLITSGAYDDADDPFGELRREMAADRGQS